jgi:hypothetical protein
MRQINNENPKQCKKKKFLEKFEVPQSNPKGESKGAKIHSSERVEQSSFEVLKVI